MNGAESLVRTLLKSGVDTCFANPGTSEMHFVAALDRNPGMRCVLGLFEGVVAGAADGYARMTDKSAVTLLHCGPGLANALACLHNARRANSPIVNIVGDQASYHRPLDPPLAADTEGWARGLSGWTRTTLSAATIGADAAMAVQAAQLAPGQIATLIAPSDTCWDEGGVVAEALPVPAPPPIDEHAIQEAAHLIRRGGGVTLLLAGRCLRGESLALAHAIEKHTGCKVLAQQSNARVERGQGRWAIDRLPYVIEQSLKMLETTEHLILVGSLPPVAFFAYPGKPGLVYPATSQIHVLARPEQDTALAISLLASALGVKAEPAPRVTVPFFAVNGPVNSENVAAALASVLPENAIVADEGLTFGRGSFQIMSQAAPHDWLLTSIGGAIGQGLPVATGAAVACPDRRVVALQADGSAMYTLQSLWTQAREKLDVTTVLFSNRKYAILEGEFKNVGANPGRTALDMMDIGNPDLNWVQLANGMGVEAERAGTVAELRALFVASCKMRGPFLIELVI